MNNSFAVLSRWSAKVLSTASDHIVMIPLCFATNICPVELLFRVFHVDSLEMQSTVLLSNQSWRDGECIGWCFPFCVLPFGYRCFIRFFVTDGFPVLSRASLWPLFCIHLLFCTLVTWTECKSLLGHFVFQVNLWCIEKLEGTPLPCIFGC